MLKAVVLLLALASVALADNPVDQGIEFTVTSAGPYLGQKVALCTVSDTTAISSALGFFLVGPYQFESPLLFWTGSASAPGTPAVPFNVTVDLITGGLVGFVGPVPLTANISGSATIDQCVASSPYKDPAAFAGSWHDQDFIMDLCQLSSNFYMMSYNYLGGYAEFVVGGDGAYIEGMYSDGDGIGSLLFVFIAPGQWTGSYNDSTGVYPWVSGPPVLNRTATLDMCTANSPATTFGRDAWVGTWTIPGSSMDFCGVTSNRIVGSYNESEGFVSLTVENGGAYVQGTFHDNSGPVTGSGSIFLVLTSDAAYLGTWTDADGNKHDWIPSTAGVPFASRADNTSDLSACTANDPFRDSWVGTWVTNNGTNPLVICSTGTNQINGSYIAEMGTFNATVYNNGSYIVGNYSDENDIGSFFLVFIANKTFVGEYTPSGGSPIDWFTNTATTGVFQSSDSCAVPVPPTPTTPDNNTSSASSLTVSTAAVVLAVSVLKYFL